MFNMSNCVAILLLLGQVACSGEIQRSSALDEDVDIAVLEATIEWEFARDTTLPTPLPVDVRLLDVDSLGQLFPPATERHRAAPPSATVRQLGEMVQNIRLVEMADWSKEGLVVSFGRPLYRSDTEAVVQAAFAHPTAPQYMAVYFEYILAMSPNGAWRVVDHNVVGHDG